MTKLCPMDICLPQLHSGENTKSIDWSFQEFLFKGKINPIWDWQLFFSKKIKFYFKWIVARHYLQIHTLNLLYMPSKSSGSYFMSHAAILQGHNIKSASATRNFMSFMMTKRKIRWKAKLLCHNPRIFFHIYLIKTKVFLSNCVLNFLSTHLS